MSTEKTLSENENQPSCLGAVSGSLLSDKEIEAYAFEIYHIVEDSRWFEPLQVGAKWSRDTLIEEIKRRQELIISEPDGTVRETMIDNLLVGLQ